MVQRRAKANGVPERRRQRGHDLQLTKSVWYKQKEEKTDNLKEKKTILITAKRLVAFGE